MNDVTYKDFIGYYRNLFPEGYCQHLIKEFDRLQETGVGVNRQKSEGARKHQKDDYHIFFNMANHPIAPFEGEDPREIFYKGLQTCFENYIETYSSIKDSAHIHSFGMKMQKSTPGSGYHIWHFEQGPGNQANRIIVYMIYLNTLDTEGGETEFLYQKTRVKPEENMMLLWPASYTHTHRGNLVLGETAKYVVTGWFYCE
jgi:hypothetical protein